ncbi:CdiA family toxin C-terminal domain-containing protein [Clostridium saccharobutylicum]|uniref:CdiA family toxin C-terminal domain-containing protein n=1 Tax=Clostridium saccharobutylicum TaxID=169679 RepID=UPI0015900C7C|nr:CdiA family toxin C-terminal domain-containing protein [Clostridium saccharobutylicum]
MLQVSYQGGSKAKFAENLEEHISKIDPTVPRRRGIGGAHNKVEFEKNTVNIVNKVEHPTMKGVEKVTYQVPSVDGQTGEITGWKAKTFDKTIYDPDIISTEKYMNLGKEAANDAASKGQLGREWTGSDSEGNVWRGYTDENGNVTSLFPEF